MKELDKLPFQKVLELYNLKCDAEKRHDVTKLDRLAEQFPSLFSKAFEDYMNRLKASAKLLDAKHGSSFNQYFGIVIH
ncbi:MAG: hypothetical protein WAW86_10720 [Gammaproteobacteria bacterium]